MDNENNVQDVNPDESSNKKRKDKGGIVLTLILLAALIGAAFYFFDLGEIGKKWFVGDPTKEEVDTYFPNEYSKEIGTAKVNDNSSKTEEWVVFHYKYSGTDYLLLLPKDFNSQDINARSFIRIEAGNFYPEGSVDVAQMNVKEELEKNGAEYIVSSQHNGYTYDEGVANFGSEFPLPFYKAIPYDEKSDILFYSDHLNQFELRVSDEEDKVVMELF